MVSTSHSKTITGITGGMPVGGGGAPVAMKHHTQHKSGQLGARTAVIQSPVSIRSQQPIVRHMTAAPTRTIPIPSAHPRPHVPNM